jgi:hypothetical protein
MSSSGTRLRCVRLLVTPVTVGDDTLVVAQGSRLIQD